MSFTFLTAEWRKLVMAQYEVAPEALAPHVPRGLELDLYPDGENGRCFVSLVGFLFDRVRILGLPVPLHTRFEEVNLRFYVRRKLRPDESLTDESRAERTTEPGYRRGVVFLSEIVRKPAITLLARGLYGEPYSTARTSHRWSSEGADAQAVRRGEKPLEVSYEWTHRRRWQSLAVRAGNRPEPMQPGSLDEFVTEHYWGYTARRGGAGGVRTAEYAVEHRRWRAYPVQAYRIAADFGSLYGPAFAGLSERAPDHVLLAEGAPVRIRWGGWVA